MGKRRIGVAISDELGWTAQGLETIERTRNRDDYAAVARVAREKGAGVILVGNPVNMSGNEGRQSEWVRQFAAAVGVHSGLPVRLWDERLTTAEAERVLKESGISIEKRAKAVDRLAAVILLQSYLDSIREAGE